MSSIEEVVDFWRKAGPERWFAKSDAFDDEFRARFMADHMEAAARKRDDWLETPEGALALMILLDQFPRNCFRGTAHMYATDPLALDFARRAIDLGHHEAVEDAVRVFFYLPFMHSEELADQQISTHLCKALGDDIHRHAVVHLEIVERFGRFPHRNAMFARETSPAEKDFLESGGFAG